MPGLREQAALDAQAILEDDSGFAWPFTLTSPAGVAAELKGFTTDVGQTIDPDTGQAVAGRRASVAVSLRSLPEVPVVTADSDRKPWIVRFLSILGVGTAWKVIEVLPDRALGVGVFLLEVYQQIVVQLSASVLVLPSLLLSGSFTPVVVLSGAVELPQLQLAGSFSPEVELGGTLPLPALQLSGELAPVVELSGTMALPQLQLAGSFSPVVELGGTVALPQLQLAGSFAPAVSMAASALALPSLQLAGSFAPVVSFGASTLPLPSVQLAGSFAPVVTLGGAMALPSLQLAGSFVPAVTLGGSMALPSLQLAGSFVPAVSMTASALTLPSLQLAGSFTVSTSKISGWLRLAASTAVGGEWPTVVDVLNAGSPMVQTAAVRKAAVGASANGLPTMVWDGTDVHLWPVSPALNGTTKTGIWIWYKPASVTGVWRLFTLTGASGGNTARFEVYSNGSTLRWEICMTGTTGRYADTPAATLVLGAWHGIYLQYDSSRGGDANAAVIVNGVSKTLAFFNIGAGATLGVLPAITGTAAFGGYNNVDASIQALSNGSETGPNTLAFNDNLTAAQIAAVLAFEAPT